MDDDPPKKLKKELTFIDLILLALGNIIGAGIFVMLTRTLYFGGKFTLIAFVVIAILSIISGLTYMEIVSIYKSNISEYKILEDVYGNNIATISAYIIFLFAILSTATITIALSKYMCNIVGKPYLTIILSTLIVIIMGLINYNGIVFSKIVFNTIATIMVVMLISLIIIGSHCVSLKKIINEPSNGLNGFLLASIFALFLYNGYDALIKMHDEVKDEKQIPQAIAVSLIIVTIFYIMIVIIAICLLTANQIKTSYVPISELFKLLLGENAYIISFIIGLFVMFNTAFLSLLGGTRFVYGLSKDKKIHEKFSELNKFSAPTYSILIACLIAILVVLTNNENFSVLFTNICVIILLILTNLGIIIYRQKNKHKDGEYKMPFYIGNIPILPIIPVFCLSILLIYAIYITIEKRAFFI